MARIEDEIKQKQFKDIYHKVTINVLFTGNWLMQHNARLLKPLQLSPQQFNILRILRGQHPKPASVSLLQERMLDKMSNASRLVEKLKQKGYVDRTANEKDRRQVDVAITEAGLHILAQADTWMNDQSNRFKSLSESEANMLSDLLDKMRDLTA